MSCGGTGEFEIPQGACPSEYAGDDVWEILSHWSTLRDLHLPPVAGGSLNQTAAFLQAAHFARLEEMILKAAQA